MLDYNGAMSRERKLDLDNNIYCTQENGNNNIDPFEKSKMEIMGNMQAVTVYRSCSVQSRRGLQEYFCTGNINENLIRFDNVREYLKICHSLPGFSDNLKTVCEKILLQHLNVENMFEIFDLSDSHDMVKVKEKSIELISKHLNCVHRLPEFLSMRPSQMTCLVNSKACNDKLCLRDALYNWWKSDVHSRANVHDNLIKKVEENLFPVRRKRSDHKSFLATFSFKKNSKNQECLTAKICDTSSHREKYEVVVKRSEQIGRGFSVCCMQRDVTEEPYTFFSGGGCQKSNKKMLEFDVIMNKWKTCSCMKHGRAMHSMEVVNNHVYVLGGRSNNTNVLQIEEFDRKKDTWKVIGHLKWKTHSSISAVYNENIFLFGGKNENGDNVSVIQSLNTKTKSCEVVGYLPVECSGGRAVVYENSIYIATEQGHLIKFCPESGQSRICQEQLEVKSSFSLFVDDTELHLIFGINEEKKCEPSQYVYSTQTDVWSKRVGSEKTCVPIYGQCIILIPNDMQHLPLFAKDRH